MPTRETLSFIAGLLFAIGFVPYIRAIIRRVTRPAKATWVIWASLDLITFAMMWLKGTLNSQIFVAVLGAVIIAILALKLGTAGWTLLDKLCLAAAVAGILLWQIFNDPVLGIVASQAAVFAGSLPTFVSSWEDPRRENRAGWTCGWFSCVLTLMTIPAWTLASASQPITFFVIQSIMMYILYVRAHSLATARQEA